MDELLEQFLIESRDLLAQAAHDFGVLFRSPNDRGALDSAFRAVHTLKGSVAIFALGPAERVLHHAEDILDRARKNAQVLDAGMLAALVASLDQTDRWIDALETEGGLGADAEAIAARIVGGSPQSGKEAPTIPNSPDVAAEPWLAAMKVREQAAIEQTGRRLTAFRFTPDRECFFRGEDPLATVAAVPDLVALAIMPAEHQWPSLDAFEPFACVSVLEGLSTAGIEEVRAAFRLAPDQITLAAIEPGREAATSVIGPPSVGDDVLRVEAHRVRVLADGVGELLIAVHGLSGLASEAEKLDRSLGARLRAAQADLERLTGGLYRSVSAVRSVPLAPSLRRLPRMAREIGASLDKQVAFTMHGVGVEVDKQIADSLFEPLLHLLRNAIDHGIEPAPVRAAAGKPAEGQVTLLFRREDDTIVGALTDDGAGIDPARIREAAAARGLIGHEDAAALDDASALRLIFSAGFSTAATVSEISGRGVGMNAVQTAIEALRGTIDVSSEKGRGTTFHLRLPATALTTRLLVVVAGGERYGVSLEQIAELVRVSKSEILPVGEGCAAVLRDRTVPVLELSDLLGGNGSPDAQERTLLVTEAAGCTVALAIDAVGSRIDTLVRPSVGLLAGMRGILGSAVLSDGEVMLVLDLAELAR